MDTQPAVSHVSASANLASPARSPEGDAAREAAAQFEAMLFKEAFAPLAKAMGFYGDSIVAAAAQAMMRSAGTGLTNPVASVIDAAARDGGMR